MGHFERKKKLVIILDKSKPRTVVDKKMGCSLSAQMETRHF